MIYDVIIAGADFAGLTVASQLRGQRVLLLDGKPIGATQTSACGTLVRTLYTLGLEGAILQVHDRLVVHTPGCTFVYPVHEPFCTFDYSRPCRLLREHGDADLGTVLSHMANDNVNQFSVMEDGQLLGIVARDKLPKFIRTHSQLVP